MHLLVYKIRELINLLCDTNSLSYIHEIRKKQKKNSTKAKKNGCIQKYVSSHQEERFANFAKS